MSLVKHFLAFVVGLLLMSRKDEGVRPKIHYFRWRLGQHGTISGLLQVNYHSRTLSRKHQYMQEFLFRHIKLSKFSGWFTVQCIYPMARYSISTGMTL